MRTRTLYVRHTDEFNTGTPDFTTPVTLPQRTGFGDTLKYWIKRILNKDPCAQCNIRRSYLNQLIPYIPRDSREFILWNLVLLRDPEPETVDPRAEGTHEDILTLALNDTEYKVIMGLNSYNDNPKHKHR